MDRRDALRSLAGLVSATGMTVSAVTVTDAESVALVVFKSPRYLSAESVERLRLGWEEGMKGTPFEGVKAMILGDGLDVEFVRK